LVVSPVRLHRDRPLPPMRGLAVRCRGLTGRVRREPTRCRFRAPVSHQSQRIAPGKDSTEAIEAPPQWDPALDQEPSRWMAAGGDQMVKSGHNFSLGYPGLRSSSAPSSSARFSSRVSRRRHGRSSNDQCRHLDHKWRHSAPLCSHGRRWRLVLKWLHAPKWPHARRWRLDRRWLRDLKWRHDKRLLRVQLQRSGSLRANRAGWSSAGGGKGSKAAGFACLTAVAWV
jgi:hypothetical protein